MQRPEKVFASYYNHFVEPNMKFYLGFASGPGRETQKCDLRLALTRLEFFLKKRGQSTSREQKFVNADAW